MHIGFLTPEYPHKITGHSGGIGTSIYNLARGLVELGVTVTIFVSGQLKDATFIDEKISIVRIKNVKLKGFSWWLTRKKIQRVINKYIRKQNIKIIEVPDWGGLSAFVNLKCPLIIRCNGSDTYFCHLEGRKVKPQNYYLERVALKNAQGIIAVSDYTATNTASLFGIEKDKISVIPNGILTDKFTYIKTYEENSLLYYGTIIRKKGLLELPLIFNEIIKNNSNVTLTLIGTDAIDLETKSSTWHLMNELFSEQARPQVKYKGVIPYHDLLPEIIKSHVCVFPSFIEAFPVSWLEAMACGKAIVASNIGWSGECITNGLEGYLVHPKNHQEFANRIMELLSDEHKSIMFGKEARSRVIRDFDISVIAKKSLLFYEKVSSNG